MLGLGLTIAKASASVLTYVKDNLKLYLDFKSSRSDTLAFPSEGSTSFDSGEYILFSKITFTDAFTIGFWFKGDTETDYKLLLKDSTDGSSNDILVKDTNGQVTIRINGAYKAIIGSTPHNTWCHLVFTRDASGNIKSYLNGVASGTQTSTHTFALDTIGYSSGGAIFNMANLGMWSRELSLEEVNSVMNKNYSQLGSVEKTSLVMWQSLDSVDTTGRMDTPAVGTGAITTSFPTNIYLNSHGTTEYTEVMANNGNLTTQGAWTIQDYGDDSAFADTGVYSEGALKAKNQIITKVAVNSTNASVLEAFIVGQLYKFEITYTRVDGQHAQSWYIGINESYGGINDLIFKEGYWNNDQGSASEKTITGYFIHQTGKNYLWIRLPSASIEIHIKTISIKKVTNNAGGGGISITNNNNHYSATLTQGATTTTSVYGGNAPILPRAIDIAESQAEQIGDGSALLNTVNINGTDRISIEKTLVLGTNNFTMTAWVNSIGGDDGYQGAVSIGTATNNQSVYIGILANNEWGFGLFGANYDFGYTVVGGEWHHLTMTREGSNIKLYFNGILVDTQSAGSLSITDGGTHIGSIGDNNTYNFNGNISQVGIWQGALSQSQVQSLMESTSYAKIPASVKSTLGSEKVGDSSFEDASYWTTLLGNGGVDVNTTNAGKLTVANAHETRLSKAGILENGKLYKLDFVVDSYASGRIVGQTGFTDFFTPKVGTNTKYFVASGTDFSIHFDKHGTPSNTNATLTMTDISIKEVTNDLVAYYPLDADSSNTVKTDDLVGGETLSADYVSGGDMSNLADSGSNGRAFIPTSNWNHKHDANSGGNSEQFSQADNGALRIFSKHDGIHYYHVGAQIDVTTDELYKLVFDAKTNDATKTRIALRYANGNNMAYGAEGFDENVTLTTEFQTFTYYFVPTAHNNAGRGLFFGRIAGSHSYSVDASIDNVSIKKVTSNTGVLK